MHAKNMYLVIKQSVSKTTKGAWIYERTSTFMALRINEE